MRDHDRPELPGLDPGVQLLDTDDHAATGPLAALVVDHLLRTDGRAHWVDAGGHARTGPLSRLAPSPRLLARVRVARGFTAHQHAELVRRLGARLDDRTALVVAPALDSRYREDSAGNGRELLLRSLARLARTAREHDVPVLVTRARADEFATPLSRAAERVIAYERTRFGPRFQADGFETLVYPDGDGTVQTTLAFWRSVLATRHDGVAADATSPAPDTAAADRLDPLDPHAVAPREVVARGSD